MTPPYCTLCGSNMVTVFAAGMKFCTQCAELQRQVDDCFRPTMELPVRIDLRKTKPAIIVDLDGTFYNAKDRQDKHLRGEKKDFDAFHADAHLDQPFAWCAELVKAFIARGYYILFVSGRDDTYREETIYWLIRATASPSSMTYLFHTAELIMRPAGDYTPDDEMKEKFYRELIEPKYNVLFCIDDRQRVVDMWRRIGLTCLQCDVGNF